MVPAKAEKEIYPLNQVLPDDSCEPPCGYCKMNLDITQSSKCFNLRAIFPVPNVLFYDQEYSDSHKP